MTKQWIVIISLATFLFACSGHKQNYAPVYSVNSKQGHHSKKEIYGHVNRWVVPAHGVVVVHFSRYNKGINVAGHLGDPIYASAAGKVVYAGTGLRDYGNLIIIKHNASYLTAYAYNDQILVREGEWVTEGQVIAKMGNSGKKSKKVMLHFELRKDERPVNPMLYLSR